jgi:hypothetical protein
MNIFVVFATLWIRISANGKILLMSPPLTKGKITGQIPGR